jgi:hypothetical protein
VKFLRFFLTCLATLAVLAAILLAAAFAPPVQTWFARMELADLPGLRVSLGSLSAAFGKVEIEDARLQYGDAVLTLPSLQARLPVVDALRHGKILVGSLVAKGWTLDLSRIPEAARERALDAAAPENADGSPVNPPAAAAKEAARVFTGILGGWRLPVDASLDGADLEGDVLVEAIPGKEPVRLHVTLKGGGVAAGREGSFEVNADSAFEGPGSVAATASLHGRLAVAMETPRVVSRAEITAEVSAKSGSFQEDLSVSAGAAQARGADGETYTLGVARGARNLASLNGGFSRAAQRFDGTWTLDLHDSDLAPFVPGRPLPLFSLAGNGRFDADESFGRVHALGRLNAVASRLGALAPGLGRTGTAALGTAFDVVRIGHSLHVDRLDVSVSSEHPVIVVQALQAFDVDELTRTVTVGDPRGDWLDVSFHGFPLAWLPAFPGGMTFAAGDATGEFAISSSEGGFALRPRSPITAAGATLQRAVGIVGRGLDLSLLMSAEYSAKELVIQWAPLSIESNGRRLMTFEARGSRPAGSDQPMAITGAVTADLDALASQPNIPGLRWAGGHSAKCDFSGSLGSSIDLQGNLVLVGHNARNSVTATVNADMDSGGTWDFLAPVKITLGTSSSDVSVEGSWARQKSDPRWDVKVSGDNVVLGHLLVLAAPIAAAGGAPIFLHGESAATRDRVPFWGGWVGRLAFAFEKLRTGDQDFTDVGGSLEMDHGSLQLEGGHGEIPPKGLAKVEGSITFDDAAERPYILAGTASVLSNLDSALLLPPQPGEDPVIEGKFSAAGTFAGTGASLGDLIDRTQEEFQLTSTSGILRLLKTSIADTIPESAEPVSDSVGAVGEFVGSVLGIKGRSPDGAKNSVGKIPEAVISFTNQVAEIGYDKVTVTAVRGADRSIRLVDLEMISPDAHLKGSGRIAYAKGLPVSQEPLTLDLQLGVRDVSAKLLATAGLLSAGKDALGYPLLNQPARFAGTLVHIDESQWHDLLAKAANQKPEAKKKAPEK